MLADLWEPLLVAEMVDQMVVERVALTVVRMVGKTVVMDSTMVDKRVVQMVDERVG